MHPYYKERYRFRAGDFPVAAGLYEEIVTLPLFPGMTDEQVMHVAQSARSVITAMLKEHG
jgi:dTDP-4-amino-4,6-dideoxygalactose transaminase